jgi:N-acetylneuraminic acid mutarotase
MRVASLAALLLLAPVALAASTAWETRAPLPVPRTEVVAAVVGNEIAVAGGFNADGSASARVDLYSPARDRWRQLPDLPFGVHHAMAAGVRGRLYVLGGYRARGMPTRAGYVLERGRWRALPLMPFPRAAAGVGVARGKLVVAGGVTTAGRLARNALSFDLATRRWSLVPGPTPREHLGVTALGGIVYAVAGRTAGIDTNLLDFESYRPGDRSWRRLQPVPDARGGTGAAALSGMIVSVGGEEPAGTIEEVLAYRVAERRWTQLEDLPTSRHGVGVAALGGRVFVIGGGPEPGLTVSAANEALRVPTTMRRPASAGRSAVSTLAFRRADGSRIRFRGTVRAWCGAWDEQNPTRALHVAVLTRGGSGYARPFWLVQAVLRDVSRGRVLRFPVGFDSSSVRGGITFVYDASTRNEVSSEDEAAKGRMAFSPIRCDLGSPVRFSLSGKLGSELLNGQPVSVSGTFRGVVGRRPAWAPR